MFQNARQILKFCITSGILSSVVFNILTAPLDANEGTIHPPPALPTPWFTGPLIAPTGTALTKGHYTLQPFLYFGAVTGTYNSNWKAVSNPNFYNVSLELVAQVGLNEFMDIQVLPLVLLNSTQGHSSTHFGDLPVIVDFQLLSDGKFKWFPGIKLAITETFPTGKYQKLNPNQLGTQVSGLGSFSTTTSLVFYKIYHLSGRHFLTMTASFDYTYFAPVHVKGFNVYGGGIGARSKVYPGNLSTMILSFEYALTQNWVLSLDNVYTHENKDRFKGTPGIEPDFAISSSISASIGRPSSEQLSFAPAIEYNFSEELGLIAGVWFTATGRNTPQFYNGIISFVYAY